MKWITLLLLPVHVSAGFSELDSSDLYQYQKPQIHKVDKVQIKHAAPRPSSNKMDALAKKILEEDRKLTELLERSEKRLIVRTKEDKIVALTRVKGIMLNSVLATTSAPVSVLIRLDNSADHLAGAELHCQSVSAGRRIIGACDLMVLDEVEYPIKAKLWDLDGAEGIIADHVYTGEEKRFLSSSMAAFMSGALDAAKDRIITPFGEVTRTSGKNKVLSGLTGVADNARAEVAKSGQDSQIISFAQAGKPVVIFFNKSLTLTKGEK